MSSRIDITGERYERLLVIRLYGVNRHGAAEWLCKCDCGGTAIARGTELRKGRARSCGCLQRELLREGPRYRAKRPSRPAYVLSNIQGGSIEDLEDLIR